VRRHHHGPWSAREFYADLVVPLSLVGQADKTPELFGHGRGITVRVGIA